MRSHYLLYSSPGGKQNHKQRHCLDLSAAAANILQLLPIYCSCCSYTAAAAAILQLLQLYCSCCSYTEAAAAILQLLQLLQLLQYTADHKLRFKFSYSNQSLEAVGRKNVIVNLVFSVLRTEAANGGFSCCRQGSVSKHSQLERGYAIQTG